MVLWTSISVKTSMLCFGVPTEEVPCTCVWLCAKYFSLFWIALQLNVDVQQYFISSVAVASHPVCPLQTAKLKLLVSFSFSVASE